MEVKSNVLWTGKRSGTLFEISLIGTRSGSDEKERERENVFEREYEIEERMDDGERMDGGELC